MNTPIVIKGVKNPDGTIVAEYFGKVHVDFIAIREVETLNTPITGLDNFKLAGLYRGVLEERNSLRGLVESNGAILFVTYDPATNKVLQFLQVKKDIYTREFDNNVWSNWRQGAFSVDGHTHDSISATGGSVTVYHSDDETVIQMNADKVEGRAIDTTPTGNSEKLITSGGVAAALSRKANTSHTHTKSQITDFPTTWNAADVAYNTSVSPSGSYPVSVMINHFVEKEEQVDEALAGKANVEHGHQISDVSGLQAALDGKAAASHTQAISTITGLQSALEGKLAGNVNVVMVNQSTTKNVHEMVGNGLFLFVGGTKQLNQIIVGNEGDRIYYHQEAGESQSLSMMCRVYYWESPDALNNYFVEIVGLWD